MTETDGWPCINGSFQNGGKIRANNVYYLDTYCTTHSFDYYVIADPEARIFSTYNSTSIYS